MDIKLEEGSKLVIQQEFENLLRNNIEESNDEWASPLVPVMKSNGKVRL